jgi:hypothetical protein
VTGVRKTLVGERQCTENDQDNSRDGDGFHGLKLPMSMLGEFGLRVCAVVHTFGLLFDVRGQ